MDSIIVAGIQIFCDSSKKNMLDKAKNYIEAAFQNNKNIDLIVLPEQFYQIDSNVIEDEAYGELPHKEFEEWVISCALKYNVNIIAGSYPVIDGNNIKNRCLVCDRMGNIVGKYDKIHLFDAFGIKESDTFEAGEELGLFDLDIGKIGVWICYDTRFPEISRSLTLMGADILCVPAAFYRPNSDQWETLIKAASIYNVLPVIAVNQYGEFDNGRGLFGRSMITDAKGIITAGASDKEGYFIGEIDKEFTKICRRQNPELDNRKLDLYERWYKNH